MRHPLGIYRDSLASLIRILEGYLEVHERDPLYFLCWVSCTCTVKGTELVICECFWAVEGLAVESLGVWGKA